MKIIKKITIDFNKANANVVELEVRQGDTGGRYIQADLTVSGTLYKIPDGCEAVVDATINDEVVVAENLPCVIEDKRNSVLIPITEFMCVAHGHLKIVLKISKGNISVAAQEIWVTVVRDIINDSTENLYKPINDTNAFLRRTTTGEFPETTGLEYERMSAVENSLDESKEKLTNKGVEIHEPFGVNDIPQAIENIEAGGEYKELAEEYKQQAESYKAEANTAKEQAEQATAQAEAEKARADLAEEQVGDLTEQLTEEKAKTESAEANAQAEKTRADEATERAENAETQIETYRVQAETAQAEKVEAEEKAQEAESNFAGIIDRSLTEITIPKEVTTIGRYGLSGFANLTKINFNEGLTEIGYGAISFCVSLAELVLPESVKYLGQNMISGSHKIKSIIIPKNVIEWGSALSNSAIETVIVEKGVTILSPSCCGGCSSLKTVNLPNTIESAYASSFTSCKALEFVTLEQGFNCSLGISASTLYSVETLVAMLEALADLTGQTAKTLTIGSTNLAKLTEEQIAIATNKNWTLA